MPMRFMYLRAFVPQITTCLRALNYCVPTRICAFIFQVPTCLHVCIYFSTNIYYYIYFTYMPIYIFISCLRALIFHVLTCLQPLTKYIVAHFYTFYCCFSMDYLTFHSIQNPKTNSCL